LFSKPATQILPLDYTANLSYTLLLWIPIQKCAKWNYDKKQNKTGKVTGVKVHKKVRVWIKNASRVCRRQINGSRARSPAISQQCFTECLQRDKREMREQATARWSATTDADPATDQRHTMWISKLCPFVSGVWSSIAPGMADRPASDWLLAPLATDCLPGAGEKFHAVLPRVITPITGVVICVSAGATTAAVQLRHDTLSDVIETTRGTQWCDWTMLVRQSAATPPSPPHHSLIRVSFIASFLLPAATRQGPCMLHAFTTSLLTALAALRIVYWHYISFFTHFEN